MNKHETAQPSIVCENLSFSWQKQPGIRDYILKDVSFSIEQGEFISFIGPSGCGKSTLLNLLSGLLKASSGRVIKDGLTVSGPEKDLGFVFQDYSLFPWLNVKSNVAFGLKLNGAFGKNEEDTVDRILKMVGLWEARRKYPFQLSGGMKQRTAIARVLACNSHYLLMDEPFGALDYQTRGSMQQFLSEVCAEFKKTVLFVTHHVEEAIILSDKVFLMSVNQQGSIEQLGIDMPRDRDVTSHQFNEYRKHIINHLNQQKIAEHS